MLSRTKNSLLLIAMFLFIGALVACSSSADSVSKGEEIDTGLSPDTIVNTAFKDKFPLEYESYLKNMESDEAESKFIEDEPYIPILFLNYGFSVEHNHTRGHTFAIDDVIEVARINDDSPGSCMTCKGPAVPHLIDEMGDDYWNANFREEIVPRMIEMGEGGEADELGEYGHLAIGCADCHDPVTMDLRITRPSLTNALERQGIDVTKASKNDMRSYVCAQCHVEYYFDPDNNGKVTFPWDEGTTPADMFEYFETTAKEEKGFDYDWVSTISGAPMIKAQHPEFETWSHGTHGQADVSCADCHMPYERKDGKKKVVSHNWKSPMDNIEQSCRTCHNDKSEKYLKDRVEDIQTRHLKALGEAQLHSVNAHYYVNRMITAGAPEEAIEEAQYYVRKGQWFWDFVSAENADGFHDPHGAMDALRDSSDASNKAVKIATNELAKLDIDLEELDHEIEKVIETVYNEDDPFKKHEHALNDYFPNVLELED